MSLAFNDLTTYRGLVQQYEREIGANQGDISSNTARLKQFTADVNLALDDYTHIAIESSGRWKFDDSNHTDFPEITTNLVSGQRSYTFTEDETGNLILDIYKVYVKDANGEYQEIKPVDPDSQIVANTVYNGLETTGTVYQYDKTANAILLDLVPASNVTNGLKVSINREASYFTYSDTTKKAGIPGLHHKYLFMKPALEYARRNNLASYLRIEAEVMRLEQAIISNFNRRGRDENRRLTVRQESNK